MAENERGMNRKKRTHAGSWVNLRETDNLEDLSVEGMCIKLFLKEIEWEGLD
jgi:hypothetical protein